MLLHTALTSQLCVPFVHSSISRTMKGILRTSLSNGLKLLALINYFFLEEYYFLQPGLNITGLSDNIMIPGLPVSEVSFKIVC